LAKGFVQTKIGYSVATGTSAADMIRSQVVTTALPADQRGSIIQIYYTSGAATKGMML
jgi:hypothetical protein